MGGVSAHRRSEISSVGEKFKFTQPTVTNVFLTGGNGYVLTRYDDTCVFILCNQMFKMGVACHLAEPVFSLSDDDALCFADSVLLSSILSPTDKQPNAH